MDYRRIDGDLIEIFPGKMRPEEILEGMARVSYDLATTVPPRFVQPFDIPASMVDFRELVKGGELHLDYLNGRLCSTHVEKKGNRYLFDAKRFEEDRGSPDVFLDLVKRRLEGFCDQEQGQN